MVEVDYLYSRIKEYGTKLIAGAGGITNPVKWFHIMEGVEISPFLEQYSIVFTTGIALQDSKDLIQLIKKQQEKGTSAAIINLGPHIYKIPQEVIDFCNEKEYPLFTVPWNVKLPHLMKVFGTILTEAERSDRALADALKNAVLFPIEEDMYKPTLIRYGFDRDSRYGVVVFHYSDNQDEIDKMEHITTAMQQLVKFYSEKILVVCTKLGWLVLFTDCSNKKIISIVEKILNLLNGWKTNCFAGIGNSQKGMTNIFKSYKEALNALEVRSAIVPDQGYMEYSEIGVYQLLLNVEDEKVIQAYCEKFVGVLYRYDQKFNTNFMELLFEYLESDCSIKRVSEKFFMHRNTVYYQLQKIQELLQCDFHDVKVKVQIYLALCYYRLKKKKIEVEF